MTIALQTLALIVGVPDLKPLVEAAGNTGGLASWAQAVGTVAAILASCFFAIWVPLYVRGLDIRRQGRAALSAAGQGVMWISRLARLHGDVSASTQRFGPSLNPVAQLEIAGELMREYSQQALGSPQGLGHYLAIRHYVAAAFSEADRGAVSGGTLAVIAEAAWVDLEALARVLGERLPISESERLSPSS